MFNFPWFFSLRPVRGVATNTNSLTKQQKRLANPKNCWTNLTEVDHGQSTTALIFVGSIWRLPLETTNPRKDIEGV